MAVVKFRRQTTRTNAAAERSEGAAYAESAFAWTIVSVNVETIGHLLPISDEVLADDATVSSLVNQDMRQGLRDRLNARLIIGNGTSPNIQGIEAIVPAATTLTAKTSSTTILDYLYNLATLVRTQGWVNPNVLYIDAANWGLVRLAKASGLYILGRPDEADPVRIWGMLPVQTEALTANTAVVGDRNFVQLFTRSGVDVQVGYRANEFGEGMQTIRAGVRVANVVKRTTAFGKGAGLNTV